MRARRVLLIAMLVCASAPYAVAQRLSANSARQFVASLYSLYTKAGNGVPSFGPRSRRYYHSSLLALMRADEKAAGPGYVGAIDADPVCGCQDWEGIWDLRVEVQIQNSDRAAAKISFALSAPEGRTKEDMRRLVMTLAAENGQWHIWDVRDESDPKQPFDVRDALRSDIQKLTTGPKSGWKR